MSNSLDLMSALSSKCVEPQKRMVGGQLKHAVHRFPIKGGITVIDMMTQTITPTQTPFILMALQKAKAHK